MSQPSTPPVEGPAAPSPLTQPKPPPRPIPGYLKPLQFMGVPKAVLTWQPKLPSRNWSIFLITVSSLTYLYYDDRKQCRSIKQDYIDKVSHLAQVPMRPNEWPRKITVYTTKSPGDDDYDKASRYFKKYVKPIVVAAGIDFEITNGTVHGGLARELQMRFQERRRKLLGLEEWKDPAAALSPFGLSPQEELQRELDGAVVLVGRPAFKEWAWALKNGWCTPLEVLKVNRDDLLAKELAEDHAFDELPTEQADAELSEKDRAIAALAEGGEADGAGAPLPSKLTYRPGQPNAFTSMMRNQPKSPAAAAMEQAKSEAEQAAARLDTKLLEPPAQIPAQPPVCFVDFTNLVGWRNIPLRMVQFFQQRHKVKAGAEVGLAIVYGTKETAREFDADTFVRPDPPQGGDLDWGIESEEKYAPYFFKTEKNIAQAKETFYKKLPTKLKDTRDITRGIREPSRLEKGEPPKTEQELREKRLEKEKQWRNNLMGFNVIRPNQGVEWDERWRGSLRVLQLSQEERERIDAEQRERKAQSEAREKSEKEQLKHLEQATRSSDDLKGSKQNEV